ncbi:hypothetical protein HKW98_10135 [Stutzerimonas urumqiensis]|uniref:hypothetical protein n=1 Tax=Stutzerimonas urumqiensis TaxID=638269 RepID=UPI003BACB69C
MRIGSFMLLLALATPIATSFAQTPAAGPGLPAQQADSLAPPLPADTTKATTSLLLPIDAERVDRLEKENAHLRQRLAQAEAAVTPPMLDERQRWFVIGGVLALVCFILGTVNGRGRRRRMLWLN